MADTAAAERVVLGALFPSRTDLLSKAMRALTAEHFTDAQSRNVYSVVCRYYERHGGIPDAVKIADGFTKMGQDRGKILLVAEFVAASTATHYEDHEFSWAVDHLTDAYAARQLEEALAQGMEVLRTGREDEDGNILRGQQAARELVGTKIAEIDRHLTDLTAPEGDIRTERDEIFRSYIERKKRNLAGFERGINFGIAPLDQRLGGLQPGDLCLLFGYSSDGKSSLAVQLAWSTVVEQAKSVVFFTTETIRPQIIRRVLARHSMMSMFGLPTGLDSMDIKNSTLDSAGEIKYRDVTNDFTRNPAYGHFYVAQVPAKATVTSLEFQLRRIAREQPVDLVVMDYLALLRSGVKRQTEREELSRIIKEAKQIATTFHDGAGVPFVSPWQVNREARKYAAEHGTYQTTATAETSEATNSADLLIGLLAMGDEDSRFREARIQIAKNRDGLTGSFDVDVDFATSRFAPKFRPPPGESASTSVESLLGGSAILEAIP